MTATATHAFAPGRWQDDIDVRDFVQRNYTPYFGNGDFLSGATERTLSVWEQLAHLMQAERARGGVLDVDTSTPAAITAHGPGTSIATAS